MDLEGDRTIVITRTFAAPARILFDAWTRADLVKRWWAPKSHGVSMARCEADVRPGGAYRYVLQREGQEIAFSGTYTEVTPHSRLVYTNVFEPMRAAGEAICTVTFEERDGRTRLVSREVYPSGAVRDQVIASGMEKGMRETMEQLESLVTSLQ
jgi:uncharacterized protein YndB with AHSA1/START domain